MPHKSPAQGLKRLTSKFRSPQRWSRGTLFAGRNHTAPKIARVEPFKLAISSVALGARGDGDKKALQTKFKGSVVMSFSTVVDQVACLFSDTRHLTAARVWMARSLCGRGEIKNVAKNYVFEWACKICR